MPHFRYSAADRSGKVSDGTVEAANADEAMLALVNQGLRVRQIIMVPSPPTAGAPAKQLTRQSAPVQRQVPARAPSQRAIHTAKTSGLTKKEIRTKPGADKDRYFLFSQLAQHLKAGIGPAQALSDLGKNMRGGFSDSLEAASQAAMEGRAISDVLERYPDLYPEHVVGMVRSGEQGGFLPEACMAVADQAHNAHRFRRWYWWVWALIVNALIAIPGMWLATRAFIRTWELTEKRPGGANFTTVLQDMASAYLEKLLWPIGPIALGIWLIGYAAWRLFIARPSRRFRHGLALKWPVFGPRTKHECLTVFSWTMSNLAKAGLSPKRSWELAASAVPNLAVRDRLAALGNQMTGAERISQTIFNQRIFPNEYAPVVATAELTGDLPGAFDQLSQVSRSEFETAQNYAKARSGCWGILGCLLTSAALLAMFWAMWYHELPKKILEGMDPPGAEQIEEPESS